MKIRQLLMVWTGLMIAPVIWSQTKSDHPAMHNHQHGAANENMNRQEFEDLVANFESAERETWQKPDAVVASLGDLQGKTVMDIGSGTGYFSFRLARAGANVICADVDDRFLDYIQERIKKDNLPAGQMQVRKVPYESSTLKPAEVDIALIVDTYHHIENRIDYFTEVRRGLKTGGKLVVVDFKKMDAPVGPPVDIKMSEDQIVAELVRAGFSGFRINRDLLPYQYVIEAN